MSKVAKLLIVFLGGALLLALLYGAFITIQKQQIAQTEASLQEQIEQSSVREKKYITDINAVKEQIAAAEQTKSEIEKKLKDLEGVDVDSLKAQMDGLKKERDDWKAKVEALKKEREGLLVKLDEKPKEKIVYKYIESEGQQASAVAPVVSGSDDVYWAQVLKEKTSLELEVEKLKGRLAEGTVAITELKKKNSDFQLELSQLTYQKEEIEREIKYGKDLSDSLSLELARAQNDKKFLNDRLLKFNDENSTLREQIKQLTSTKIALEKSIVRLQEDKKSVEKKLMETENVIQGRIDEIWQIKNSLDQTMKPEAKNGNGVELAPIVVSSADSPGSFQKVSNPNAPGIDGNIVSVNTENNFVIIDIGEDSGIKAGDTLNVYREAAYVAGLEVIQVRKDIAAADIISRVSDIQVGDAVR